MAFRDEESGTLGLQVSGLNCGACVGRAEKALAAVIGVRAAEVNLATKTALVRGQGITAAAVAAALDAAGYPAVTRTLRFEIENLSCASCVQRLESALLAVPGVVSAQVNLANTRAEVEILSGSGAKDRVLEAATRAGYPARLIETGEGAAERTGDAADKLWAAFVLAAILTLPVFVLEMGSHAIPAFHMWVERTIGTQTSRLIQFVLTTVVLAWPGREFFLRGGPALLRRAPDMNSLVALGAGAAWAFSVVSTFLPAALPVGTAAVYFEAAAVIVTLILLGRCLEARAKGRTGEAIRKLVGLRAKTARVVRAAQVLELPVDDIVVGDILHLRPGEKIAVDGVVTDGTSYVDESMISGEPVPVLKAEGAPLVGGTVNGTGALVFRAEKVGADTALAQIIRMVERAQAARLPIQDAVNRITLWFVPVVMATAALTVALWLALGPAPALGHALVAGVAVLIIACPCAMGLATPTSIMVGTGRAAELGVLFRKGDALQSLQGVDIVALDKTGTLTEGRPELSDLSLAGGWGEEDVLRVVAAVEDQSEHPIAAAIVRAARARGLDVPGVEGFTSITGYGVRASVDGRDVLVGAERLMQREGVETGALGGEAAALAKAGKTVLFAAIDGQIAAVIAVSDRIKAGTRDAISALHAMGLDVAMITGDTQGAADAIARELGIDHVVAGVLPDGKVAALEKMRGADRKLAFVGDGINDAPALASAEVGIAIGTGTDVAIESADVVLMSGDLRGVVNAFRISHRTMSNIRQNLIWAFGYNVLLIPVAAGVLYIFGGPLLSPALAAGAMALSSVFVVSNALRLRFVPAAVPHEGAAGPQAADAPAVPAQ
ncbi:MAG: copper-translocating P-type ATPase [Paracoccaceae bacterium]